MLRGDGGTGRRVEPCPLRRDVQVRFDDGRTFCGQSGTPLGEFVAAATGDDFRFVAGIIDGRLRELDWPIDSDVGARLVHLSDEAGYRLYQASAILLLEASVVEVLPAARLQVEHSVPFGGLYCELEGDQPPTSCNLEQIKRRMQALVERDEAITRAVMTPSAALEHFESTGETDRSELLRGRTDGEIEIRELANRTVLAHSPLLPSSGGIRQFDLSQHPPGFILHLPQRRGGEISGEPSYPKLAGVFAEYSRWLRMLEVENVGALNTALRQGRGRELMLVGESLHSQRISEIAAQILERKDSVRVILIAGPSSAGKTSFAKRLAIQLMSNGLRPHPLSLDDYFLPRSSAPVGEDGIQDFESLDSLDLELLGAHLKALLEGERVLLPRYNFITGQRETGQGVRLDGAHVLLIEGLHGLNPDLLPAIEEEAIFRIYVSALTQLRLDRISRIPTTDTRLIRRIVRDSHSRGYNAQKTLSRWRSVRLGEERNIFPYQENADEMFNSAMPHELSVLRRSVEPLLRQVDPEEEEYVEARRLLELVSWFDPCEVDLVPEESILREFLGGSVVVDFVAHRGRAL